MTLMKAAICTLSQKMNDGQLCVSPEQARSAEHAPFRSPRIYAHDMRWRGNISSNSSRL